MTAVQDRTRNISTPTPQAAGTWNQCQTNGQNVPCGSCTIKSMSSGTFTWVCELKCTGTQACPAGTYQVGMQIYSCTRSSQTDACAETKIIDSTSIGTISVATGENATTGDKIQSFVAPTCGRVQVTIQMNSIDGVSAASRVFGTGKDCSVATTIPPSRAPTLVTDSSQPTASSSPKLTSTLAPTPKATKTATPAPSTSKLPLSTTPTPTPTLAAVCAPSECGMCGWKDAAGLCHQDGAMPSGRACCYKGCEGAQCKTLPGNGADTCTTDSACVQPTKIASAFKCDARCGICGISDVGSVCSDRTSLPDGSFCCHNVCAANSCTKVSGVGIDQCVSNDRCTSSGGQAAISSPPSVTPVTQLPVTGDIPPWYIFAIPALIIILGVAL